MKQPSGGNRIVFLTVSMIALAGLLVGAVSYLRTRSLADEYDAAMETELQQKGLAYGQTAQSLLSLVAASSPQGFDALLSDAIDNPDGVLTQFTADQRGDLQNNLLGFEVWAADPAAPGSYALRFRHDVAGGRVTTSEDTSIAPLIVQTAATGEPAAKVDDDDQDLHYSFLITQDGKPNLIVVATLDSSPEFAFFGAQRHRAIRDAIIFAVGSVAFVSLVGGGLSYAVSRTLTNRKRAADVLHDSELRYRTLAELSPVGIFRNDGEGKNIYVNQRVQEMLDLTPEASFGEGWVNGLHPEDRERVLADWAEALRSDIPFGCEYRFVRRDGTAVWVLGQAAAERTTHGEIVGYVGTLTDITERKQMEEALREQARRDSLTGVLNHAAIVEELRRIIAAGDTPACALAMVDVDEMKAINDTHGHYVGDEALRTVSRALQCRGAVVGRYGGDEFVVVLPGFDQGEAEQYQREVAEEVAKTRLVDPDTMAKVPLSVTIGFAFYPQDSEAIAGLINLADSAMYAQRRQRPVAPDSRARRSPADDEVARMVGEIVPLLTSPGDIQTKLHFVAQRLLVGTGHDAVNAILFSPQPGGPALSSTVARVNEEFVRAYDDEQRQEGEASTIRPLLEKVQRPFIMEDLANDDRLTAVQRELLGRAGLRSGLVAPMMWQGQTLGALAVGSKRPAAFGPADAQLLNAVAGQVAAVVRMETLVVELQDASARLGRAHEETVMLLAASAEAHDPATGRHLHRVQHLVETIARELGESQEEAYALGLAAVLHDIGKLFVPDHVLASPGKLDHDEWQLMTRHTIHGQTFLADRTGFELAATIARSHHERWDGAGYPDGLCVGEISDAVAIVTVADAFDAMTSDRSYRPASSGEDAMAEIVRCRGKQFAPHVVEALARLYERGALASEPVEPVRLAA